MSDNILQQEIQTFEANQEHLEKEHFGKFALIRGAEVINTYDTFENAAEEALRRFGNEPFMIRQIGKKELTLPPAVIYGLTG